jgi:WD40 repeat protein
MVFAVACNGFNDNGCEVRLWDRRMLRPLRDCIGHTQAVQGCAFVGNSVASVSQDQTLRLWDVASADCTHTVPLRSRGGFTALASAGNDTLFSATFRGGLQRWVHSADGPVLAAATQPPDDGLPDTDTQ